MSSKSLDISQGVKNKGKIDAILFEPSQTFIKNCVPKSYNTT